ncbi:UNVERIFIED_CONTAM: hypothetical protein K2H54_036489, partial [Gekko kuhli]
MAAAAAVGGVRALSLAALRGGVGAAVANCCCRRWRRRGAWPAARRLLSTGAPPQVVGAGLTEAVLRDAVKQKQGAQVVLVQSLVPYNSPARGSGGAGAVLSTTALRGAQVVLVQSLVPYNSPA